MSLDDKEVGKVTELIRNSFRVHPNEDPVYVDLAGHLDRVRAQQHQIVFGRRGSGKSCLLVHYHRNVAKNDAALSAYINCDDVKRLGYPDVLIRLLLSILEGMDPRRRWWKRYTRTPDEVIATINELRDLLDDTETAQVVDRLDHQEERGGEASIGKGGAKIGLTSSATDTTGTTRSYQEKKLDTLERHAPDYRKAIVRLLAATGFKSGAVLLDDFYLLPRSVQPDVIDFLHSLLRGTSVYLKVGTVRHRTSLLRETGQPIGVKIDEDVEAINLDLTFSNLAETQQYLTRMLNSMAERVGAREFSTKHISPDGQLELAFASGGVPRDYLTIFRAAVDAAIGIGALKWLTPKPIYKGAGRISYQTKLEGLRRDVGTDAADLELVFRDLINFCLREKKKTAFLISQEEVGTHPVEHELIEQLMDFKLVHVIEPDTSAASGRPGRYEAYTLDAALFMEPRLRGIERVEFWRVDAQRRQVAVREAPVYDLARARGVIESADETPTTETFIDGIEQEVGVEDEGLATND